MFPDVQSVRREADSNGLYEKISVPVGRLNQSRHRPLVLIDKYRFFSGFVL